MTFKVYLQIFHFFLFDNFEDVIKDLKEISKRKKNYIVPDKQP